MHWRPRTSDLGPRYCPQISLYLGRLAQVRMTLRQEFHNAAPPISIAGAAVGTYHEGSLPLLDMEPSPSPVGPLFRHYSTAAGPHSTASPQPINCFHRVSQLTSVHRTESVAAGSTFPHHPRCAASVKCQSQRFTPTGRLSLTVLHHLIRHLATGDAVVP